MRNHSEQCGPTDQEMLDTLDAYGHLQYIIGEEYPEDPEREAELLLAFDWNVFVHPEHPLGDIIVAYHVVFDAPSSLETIESGIFCIDDWTEEDIRQWCGAPLIKHIDGVNDALAMDGSEGYIGWEQVREFETLVAEQFAGEVAYAKREES